MSKLTIGDLAKRAGVKVATLRYYERRGLLEPPPRTPGGYRLYPQSETQRVRFIKNAQSLGFSLAEIKELLLLKVDPGVTCQEVKDRAQAKLVQIEEKIQSLQEMRRALADISARCRGQGPLTACPILESLEEQANPKGEKP